MNWLLLNADTGLVLVLRCVALVLISFLGGKIRKEIEVRCELRGESDGTTIENVIIKSIIHKVIMAGLGRA